MINVIDNAFFFLSLCFVWCLEIRLLIDNTRFECCFTMDLHNLNRFFSYLSFSHSFSHVFACVRVYVCSTLSLSKKYNVNFRMANKKVPTFSNQWWITYSTVGNRHSISIPSCLSISILFSTLLDFSLPISRPCFSFDLFAFLCWFFFFAFNSCGFFGIILQAFYFSQFENISFIALWWIRLLLCGCSLDDEKICGTDQQNEKKKQELKKKKTHTKNAGITGIQLVHILWR